MPIDKYYGGSGDDVMRDMTKRYGTKRGKHVFYATAQKHRDPMMMKKRRKGARKKKRKSTRY